MNNTYSKNDNIQKNLDIRTDYGKGLVPDEEIGKSR